MAPRIILRLTSTTDLQEQLVLCINNVRESLLSRHYNAEIINISMTIDGKSWSFEASACVNISKNAGHNIEYYVEGEDDGDGAWLSQDLLADPSCEDWAV